MSAHHAPVRQLAKISPLQKFQHQRQTVYHIARSFKLGCVHERFCLLSYQSICLHQWTTGRLKKRRVLSAVKPSHLLLPSAKQHRTDCTTQPCGHSIAHRLENLFFHLENYSFDSVSSGKKCRSFIQAQYQFGIYHPRTLDPSLGRPTSSPASAMDQARVAREKPLTPKLRLEAKSQLEKYREFSR